MKDKHVRTHWYRFLALFLGLALTAAACGSDDEEPNAGGTDDADETTTTAAPEGTPVKGGELIFGTESDVATLDVGAAAQPSDKVITLGVYDPLTTWTDGELVPYLAESVESSDDLATYDDDAPLGRHVPRRHPPERRLGRQALRPHEGPGHGLPVPGHGEQRREHRHA